MEFDSQSSNEDNCSSSDSCSDMGVDNTEEHKEQSISKQERINKKTFSYYSHNDQNIIMLHIYTKQRSFHGLKQKPVPFLIITIYSENLLKKKKPKQVFKKEWGWACQIYSQWSW